MNKISRRNFIAAIAAIGMSFALVGCSNAEPVGEITYQPQTKIISVDEDNNFVVNSIGYGVTHDGYVQADFTLVNNTDHDISFTDADASVDGDGNYSVNVKAYFDGKYEKINTVASTGVDNLMDVTIKGADDDMIVNNYTVEGAFYVKAPDDWKSMVLVFTMMVDGEPSEVQFTFMN